MIKLFTQYKKTTVGIIFLIVFFILFLAISDPSNNRIKKSDETDNRKTLTTETKLIFEVNEIIINDNVLGSLGRVFLNPKKVKLIIRKDTIDQTKMKIELDIIDSN